MNSLTSVGVIVQVWPTWLLRPGPLPVGRDGRQRVCDVDERAEGIDQVVAVVDDASGQAMGRRRPGSRGGSGPGASRTGCRSWKSALFAIGPVVVGAGLARHLRRTRSAMARPSGVMRLAGMMFRERLARQRIADRGGDAAEVAAAHGAVGSVRRVGGREAADLLPLLAPEEEQLVLLDRARPGSSRSRCSAARGLVHAARVVEEVVGVQVVVAVVLEERCRGTRCCRCG